MNRSRLLGGTALLAALLLALPPDALAQRRGGGGGGGSRSGASAPRPGGPSGGGYPRGGYPGGAGRAQPRSYSAGPSRPPVAVARPPGYYASRGYYPGRYPGYYPGRAFYPGYYAGYPYYWGGPYYYPYSAAVNFGFFYGAPGFYGAYGWGAPYWGFGVGGGYPVAVPYGYGYGGYSGRPYGGVRLDLPQRQAEVFVDGYFVGTVDNFDGKLQQANLEAGPHRLEVRQEGFEPVTFDVNVEVGQTITYRTSLKPAQP